MKYTFCNTHKRHHFLIEASSNHEILRKLICVIVYANKEMWMFLLYMNQKICLFCAPKSVETLVWHDLSIKNSLCLMEIAAQQKYSSIQ